MPRSHKPRKRYVPKRVEFDPVGAAHGRASLLPDGRRSELLQPMHAALERLRGGAGDWGAWCSMADAMNVAERLALLGIASDRRAEFDAAQAALAAVHERVQAGGCWTLRGPEIHALTDAAELHEVQMQLCTQGELVEAISTVQRRVAQALAGNAPRSARICVAGHLGRSNEA